MSRIRANQITNQSADGAPTVQNGLVISGVTTSTTFSGSGASLTNIPSAQLTGALPAISGANLTGIDVTQIVTGNTSVQTVDTGSDGHVKINTEGSERLRIDSSGRMMIGTTAASTLTSSDDLTISTSGSTGITLFAATGNAGNIAFGDGTSGDDRLRGLLQYHHSDNSMRLFTNAVRRMTINSNGAVGINTVVSDQPNVPSLQLHGSAGDDCRISFSTPTKSAPGSRIGYYGLNRFGIDTYDGIEMRDVTRSYATIFKIDNNGYMTTNQPYGHLRFNVKNDTGGLVIQTDVNTADVQNGVSHNGSGRLTVPVSGKYMIMLACNLYDDAPMQFRMMKNGSDLAGGYYQQNDSNIYWKSGMRSIIVPLSANDYIESKIQGKQDSQVWNHLTVYMLG